ncbi:gluconate 5-dehydrogenase [Thalassobacillus cyri]|uniref:Gluconate 5-dehydrogenase n=1 Tax=Thalassobacillus cyri TaxID=571932 RepID=A0A1H4ALZ3_9BACI|nr:gluconate 5-dehydrogenase [Thalassobacillus cyri]
MTILDHLFSLKGKTAIITGGGRGLGKQITMAFREAGANVVICSRKMEACEQTVKEIAEKGGSALALTCDVTNRRTGRACS